MNILCITRNLGNRGGHKVFAEITRELMRQGYDVDFVAFKPHGLEDFPHCAAVYEGIDVNIVEIPAKQNDAAQIDEYISAATEFLKTNQQYDKIILDSWFIAAAGIVARLDFDKTYQLVQSDPVFAPEDDSIIWKSRFFAMLPLYPMQRVIVSRTMQKVFYERYGIEYPYIDLSIDDAFRTADFVVKDSPVIRFVSSASNFDIPSKGLDFLLKSLEALDRPCELTLLSGAPIRKDLTGYSFPIVETTGKSPAEMIKILAQHDVYVNTSTRETFGLSLAEAITLGMPTIALDSVGNRDFANGDNFVFVEQPGQFAEQLLRMCDVHVRHDLHDKARASMERYQLGVMVDQFKSAVKI